MFCLKVLRTIVYVFRLSCFFLKGVYAFHLFTSMSPWCIYEIQVWYKEDDNPKPRIKRLSRLLYIKLHIHHLFWSVDDLNCCEVKVRSLSSIPFSSSYNFFRPSSRLTDLRNCTIYTEYMLNVSNTWFRTKTNNGHVYFGKLYVHNVYGK